MALTLFTSELLFFVLMVSFNLFAMMLTAAYVLLYGLYLKISSTRKSNKTISSKKSDADEIDDEFIDENFHVESENPLDGKTKEELQAQLILTFRALNNKPGLNPEALKNEPYDQMPVVDSISEVVEGIEQGMESENNGHPLGGEGVLAVDEVADEENLITEVLIDPN